MKISFAHFVLFAHFVRFLAFQAFCTFGFLSPHPFAPAPRARPFFHLGTRPHAPRPRGISKNKKRPAGLNQSLTAKRFYYYEVYIEYRVTEILMHKRCSSARRRSSTYVELWRNTAFWRKIYLFERTSASYFSTSLIQSGPTGTPSRSQYSSQTSPKGKVLNSSLMASIFV